MKTTTILGVEVITEQELAKACGVHPKTIANWRLAGRFEACRFKGRPCYTLGQVESIRALFFGVAPSSVVSIESRRVS